MHKIRSIFFSFLIIIFSFFLLTLRINAKEVNVYMFYGKTCPHCEEALEYLNSIKDKYDLNIIKYEVWYNEENKYIMNDIADYLDVNPIGVPLTIIDNTPIFGYSKGVTDDTFLYHIKLASKHNFIDNVGIKLGIVKNASLYNNERDKNKDDLYLLNIFNKNIDLENVNLSLITIILGFLDGFNFFSICLLLFIISLLMAKKDKKKNEILCLLFVLSYVILYFLMIMTSINNLDIIRHFSLVRIIFSVVTIMVGGIKLIKLTSLGIDEKKKNKIFKFFMNNKYILYVIGFILLGVLSVIFKTYYSNDILMLFKNLLALNVTNGTRKIINIVVYMIFFLVANLAILSILIFLVNKIKNRKHACLIGGIILFIIGILLLLKPEWLMF